MDLPRQRLLQTPGTMRWQASCVSLSGLIIRWEGSTSQRSHHRFGGGGGRWDYQTGHWICLTSPQVCKPLFKIARGLGTFLKRNHVSRNVTFLNKKVLLPTRKSQKNGSLSLYIVIKTSGCIFVALKH